MIKMLRMEVEIEEVKKQAGWVKMGGKAVVKLRK